jgi:hypothetical protein
LDFLSAATVAGPFEAAIRAAVVILADCSFVTVLGSLVSSADILRVVGGGVWELVCVLSVRGFVFSSVRALSALVGLVAPWLVPCVFIGLVSAFGSDLLVILSLVARLWVAVGWLAGLCLGFPRGLLGVFFVCGFPQSWWRAVHITLVCV